MFVLSPVVEELTQDLLLFLVAVDEGGHGMASNTQAIVSIVSATVHVYCVESVGDCPHSPL